jgi:hypothetical protein
VRLAQIGDARLRDGGAHETRSSGPQGEVAAGGVTDRDRAGAPEAAVEDDRRAPGLALRLEQLGDVRRVRPVPLQTH